MPTATIAVGAVAWAMLRRLSVDRKSGVEAWKYTTRPIATTSTLASRRRRKASRARRGTVAVRGRGDALTTTPSLIGGPLVACRCAAREEGDGRSRGQAWAIGPERSTSFTAVSEPSYRVLVLWYGSTLSFVTNSRPVLVWVGKIRPPVSLYRYRARTGRKPCRYGCWSIV